MALKSKHKKTFLIIVVLLSIFILVAGNFGLFVYHGPPGKIKFIRKNSFNLTHIIVKCDKFYKVQDPKKTDLVTRIILVNSKMKNTGLFKTFDNAQLKNFTTTLLKELKNR